LLSSRGIAEAQAALSEDFVDLGFNDVVFDRFGLV
jgi:hypothetical protein